MSENSVRWSRKTIGMVLLSTIVVVSSIILLLRFFPLADWISGGSLEALDSVGAYSIDEVILTNELNSAGQPVKRVNKFRPSEQIIGWVSTTGTEGIVGMRWSYEEKVIFEHFGKTVDNQIFTFIHSTVDITLPEGEYRLDVLITPGTPIRTLHFTIEQYEPEVIPAQPTPIGHIDIEESPFVDVPFVFDEVWTIGDREWQINEVKITLIEQDAFVTIAVETDIELAKLSEEQAFAMTKPIARYAVNKDYLAQARNLQIDGKSYDLNEVIYVNLVNRKSANPFEPIGKPIYRTRFNINDLGGSQS